MIGEIRKALTPFFDTTQGKLRIKGRPVLILAKADPSDYVVLPVSRVTKKEHLHPIYDIKVDPAEYPASGLDCISYVRTHKQTVVHQAVIGDLVGNLKANYEDLYLDILEKQEQFSHDITDQSMT